MNSHTVNRPRHPVRVLLVDDDPDTLQALRRLLTLRGDVVEIAASFAEANELCMTCQYDLVICDVRLPDGDGRQLAQLARRRGAKAIVVSGWQVEPDAAAAFCDACLLKPMDFRQLSTTIERIIPV